MTRWAVGVDFGGTNIKIGIVDVRGRAAGLRVLSSKRYGHPAAFVDGISRSVESLAASVGVAPRRLAGVGIGAPGPVDVERGIVHSLVNVPGWHDVPLGGRLARRLRCRCLVDNDVNLFTLGEWRFGAGRGAQDLIGLTLGTGVGGGLMFDGRLYRGAAGSAGEIGHMVIDPGGRRCGCGARGCLEAQVGTKAIRAMALEAAGRSSGTLKTLIRSSRGRITPELVNVAAGRGDAGAKRIWREVGRSLGVALGNLINALNPDRIVVGGGVAKAWRFFYPTLMGTVRAQAMAVPVRAVRIVPARLGDRAAILGAALLARQGLGS